MLLAFSLVTSPAVAGPYEQAKRMHDRLAGVPPVSNATLDSMAAQISAGNPRAAAQTAMNNPNFYSVTLKELVTPWTNKEQTVFAPLNDYTATVIGMVRDGVDFRQMLYGDILYVGQGGGLPAYANSNNAHYEAIEAANLDLSNPSVLVRTTQSAVYGPIYGAAAPAPAGVLTTRAAGQAFFYAGTNRAMFRFTFYNHLCADLELIKDVSRPSDYVRQDAARSPGGDSRIYLNSCIGCHAGMDGMNGAFAYYDWEYDRNNDPTGAAGHLIYTRGVVRPKFLQNADNFKYGYVTTDDGWINYWRTGINSNLGWANNSTPAVKFGNGAQELGEELANTEAFARCQVRKVYKAVCFRDADETQIGTMVSAFKSSNYKLKDVFAEAAVSCMGN